MQSLGKRDRRRPRSTSSSPPSENDEQAIADAEAQVLALEPKLRKAELERMLSGPADRANAIVSIHPGAGGTDAKDWAAMLLPHVPALGRAARLQDRRASTSRRVTRPASTRRRSRVAGDNAYGYLRSENGVHRLVRMSPFNARPHAPDRPSPRSRSRPTSDDDIDIEVNEKDSRSRPCAPAARAGRT